ncbi:sedoheptulose-bisphosphatase [Actinidia rufa]|uniref:Sedoheptulose-bisphosphatase n=1 Tax=Actinidia rufa TaxID=165716 RepID=A0A7J0EB06_9ERIC|nr:sedoheptulose-bisphosphatase [Actinidia rufa]
METGIACRARGTFLAGISSQQYSTAVVTPPSISSSFSSKSRKSSWMFGESLRIMPKSSVKVSKIKNSSFVAKCALGRVPYKSNTRQGLIRLMMCMGEALRTIAFKVRTASCGGTACVNSFGDEQLAVDMLADKLLFEVRLVNLLSKSLSYCAKLLLVLLISLTIFFTSSTYNFALLMISLALDAFNDLDWLWTTFCKYPLLACSEEVPELQDMGGPVQGGFSVAFDPLDGSSIVDTNFTVGTIFGVWPGDKLTGVTGRDQVAAAMGIYGPRTTYVLALKDIPGTHEFLLLDEGKWLHVKDTTEIGEGKMFSPGNLRATFDNPDYDKLINYYVREKYTLRYTGGMVPDVNQVFPHFNAI